jgi:hypothetical protein
VLRKPPGRSNADYVIVGVQGAALSLVGWTVLRKLAGSP